MGVQLTDTQRDAVLALHRRLVSIRSCNTSKAQANRDRAEAEMAAFLREHLAGMGMSVKEYEYAPGRPNVVAQWPDQRGERSVALQAHMDTVGIEGMARDPFDTVIEDGRIYGRGTCDTKGSMAAFLSALAIAREAGWKPVDKWHFVATASEETGCQGAKALAVTDFHVDAIVVGEPTNCRIVTAHKGQGWVRLRVKGRRCHAAVPHEGRNAVAAMARAVLWCEEVFVPDLARRSHPLLGHGTASVDMITGGTAPNVVPAECEATIDCRTLPDDHPKDVAERLLVGVKSHMPDFADAFSLEIDQANPGFETPANRPFARNVMKVCAERTGQEDPVGVNYFADSGPLHNAGMEAVLFGPGDIAQAHTADEYLEVEQLVLATEIALEWLYRHADRSILG